MINLGKHSRCVKLSSATFVALFIAVVIACQTSPVNDFATTGDTTHITWTELDVSLGIVPGVSNARIVTDDSSIGTTTTDIWNQPGDLVWPESATTLELVSTSTEDNPAGLGIGEIEVRGLDVNFNSLVETIQLTGTTPVTTIGLFSRVNQLFAGDPDSYGGSNIGEVTATHNGTGTIQAAIDAGQGVSHKSHFTVPADNIFLARNVVIGTDATKVSEFNFKSRFNDTIPPTDPFPVFRPLTIVGVVGTTEFRLVSGALIPGKSDLWVIGTSSSPGGFASMTIEGFLIDTIVNGAAVQQDVACGIFSRFC